MSGSEYVVESIAKPSTFSHTISIFELVVCGRACNDWNTYYYKFNFSAFNCCYLLLFTFNSHWPTANFCFKFS